MLNLWLIAVHVTANLVWIGSIMSVGWISAVSAQPVAGVNAGIAYKIYRQLAVPAFLASFGSGILKLLLNPSYYLHAHWFHAKLLMVVPVIAIHHMLGGEAKRTAKKGAQGVMQESKKSATLTLVMLGCAFLAVVTAIFKSQLIP